MSTFRERVYDGRSLDEARARFLLDAEELARQGYGPVSVREGNLSEVAPILFVTYGRRPRSPWWERFDKGALAKIAAGIAITSLALLVSAVSDSVARTEGGTAVYFWGAAVVGLLMVVRGVLALARGD